MSGIIFVSTVYLIINVALLGLGCAVGFLLHWLLPEVDLGIGVLIGVVATGFTIHFFSRIMVSMKAYELDEDLDPRPITLFELEPPRPSRRRRKKS